MSGDDLLWGGPNRLVVLGESETLFVRHHAAKSSAMGSFPGVASVGSRKSSNGMFIAPGTCPSSYSHGLRTSTITTSSRFAASQSGETNGAASALADHLTRHFNKHHREYVRVAVASTVRRRVSEN